MAIKWGSTYVTAVKWGNTNCTKVKWGSTVVFPNGGYDGSSFSPPFTSGFNIYSNKNFLDIEYRAATQSDMNMTGSIHRYRDEYGGFILTLRTSYTIDMSLYNKFKINYELNSYSDMVTSEGEEFIMRSYYIGFDSSNNVGLSTISRYLDYSFAYNGIVTDINNIEQDISNITENLYFAFILYFYKGSKSGNIWYTFKFNSMQMY